MYNTILKGCQQLHGEDMTDLTDRQSEVLKYVEKHILSEGYSPTYMQLCKHFGWASATAAKKHIDALVEKGSLRKTPRGYGLVQ